jgi:hypothetical protein
VNYAFLASTVNVNPETGIRYGVIAAQSLNSDLFDDLTIYRGENESLAEALKELRDAIEAEAHEVEETFADTGKSWADTKWSDWDDYVESQYERRSEGVEIDEPVYSGTYEGVKYRVGWLGGAQIVWILESPETTHADLCSPCVPNAGNLDSRSPNGFECYDVPKGWLCSEIF